MILGPQQIGSTRSYQIDLYDSSGSPVHNVFDGTEALGSKIWPGGDLGTLATPAATWKSGPLGEILLEVTDADIAGLDPSIYRLQVTISGATVAFDGSLELTSAPGVGAERQTYCSESDLLDHADWLRRLQTETDQAGFAAERARARSWLDDVILDRYGGQGGGILYAFGIGSMPSGSGDMPSLWLRDLLNADGLVVTDRVIEITARKAIAFVCERTPGQQADNPYRTLAKTYHFQADNAVKTLRAEIDTNGDGKGDFTVNLGATRFQ